MATQQRSPEEYKRAYEYHRSQGNAEEAKRVANLYRQHLATQDTDNAFEYSIDQAQRLIGKGIEAGGRAVGLEGVEQYGTTLKEQQDKDIAAGGYQPSYNKGLRETFQQDGVGPALGWLGEKTAENAASAAVALGGTAAAAFTYPVSAPLAYVIGAATTVGSAALGAGESAFEQEEKTGAYDARLASGVGVLIGLLDKFGAGKVIPKERLMKMTAEQIGKELGEKGYKQAAAVLLKRTGIEAGTEAAQEGLSMASAAARGGQYTPQEIGDRTLEAAALGGTTSIAAQTGMGTIQSATNLVRREPGKPVTERQSQAQASFAQRLSQKVEESARADGPAYDLRDVDPDSRSGAKGAIDSAHSDMAKRLKTLVNLLKSRLKPESTDTLDDVLAKSDAAVAAIKAKNKVKNVVDVSDFEAFEALAGNTAEGQEAINLMHEMNELTRVYSEGLTGGVSRYTDVMSPVGSLDNYSNTGGVMQQYARPIATAALAAANPGLAAAQVGSWATGRAIDKVTGRRSRIAKYVAKNQGMPGQSQPTSPSLRDAEVAAQNAEADAKEAERLRQEQLDQESRQASLDLARENAPPNPESPQGIFELGTALDRNGIAQVLRILKRTADPEVARWIQAYETSVATGGQVDYRLIRKINAFVDRSPVYKGLMGNRVRNQGVVQNAVQQQLNQQQQNYERGRKDNHAFLDELMEALKADGSVPHKQKAVLLNALGQMKLDLGSDPVGAVKALADRLLEQDVSQQAIGQYFVPYIERVMQQQSAKQDKQRAAEDVASLAEEATSPPLKKKILEGDDPVQESREPLLPPAALDADTPSFTKKKQNQESLSSSPKEDYELSQLSSKKFKRYGSRHPLRELRREIAAKREKRRLLDLQDHDPLSDPLSIRLAKKQLKVKNQEQKIKDQEWKARILDNPNTKFWTKTDFALINSELDYGREHSSHALRINKANLKGLVSALKKAGWEVAYTSKHNNLVSSYYMTKDGVEVRVSDHELPTTPEREHNHSQGLRGTWNHEVIVSNRTSIAEQLAEIAQFTIIDADTPSFIKKKQNQESLSSDPVQESRLTTPVLTETQSDKTTAERRKDAAVAGFDTSTVYYHGTGSPITSFEKSKRGLSTRATSAQNGFWFSDSVQTAGSYANHSATYVRVHNLVKEAEDASVVYGDELIDADTMLFLDSLITKAGIKAISFEKDSNGTPLAVSGHDAYDKLLEAAEKLEAKFDSGDRNSGQNIIPVYLPKDSDLLVKAMDGKSFDDDGVSLEINQLMRKAEMTGKKGVKLLNLNDSVGLANDASTHIAIFEPSNIRSVNAQFDPSKVDSDALAASTVPILTQPEESPPRQLPFNFNTPTVGQIKDKLEDATDVVDFVIGKEGTRFENGITSLADVEKLAAMLDVSINVINTVKDAEATLGPVVRGNYGGGNAGTSGVINIRSPQMLGSNSGFLLTLLHEVSHAVEGQTQTQEPETGYNYISEHPKGSKAEDDVAIRATSLREALTYVLYQSRTGEKYFGHLGVKLPSVKDSRKIQVEIDKLQDEGTPVTFPGVPESQKDAAVRIRPTLEMYLGSYSKQVAEHLKKGGYKPSDFNWDSLMQRMYDDNYTSAKEEFANFERYLKGTPEFGVDPVLMYLADPKFMKKNLPTTAKFIRDIINKGNMPIELHSNPLVTVFAILLAGIGTALGGGEEDEEQQQGPGVLTPGPAALTI